MTQEKHNRKLNNAVAQEAKKHLRELRLFAARNLIKICGGDMVAAVKAIVTAYGQEYGEEKSDSQAE